jgi:hypothetical protein
VGAFIEWALRNLRRVSVKPGSTQHLYVDMLRPAMLCVRVPELQLCSVRCGPEL